MCEETNGCRGGNGHASGDVDDAGRGLDLLCCAAVAAIGVVAVLVFCGVLQ